VANTDPKNEHAGDSENSPSMNDAGAVASLIVAIAQPHRYRLALFLNNWSTRRDRIVSVMLLRSIVPAVAGEFRLRK